MNRKIGKNERKREMRVPASWSTGSTVGL